MWWRSVSRIGFWALGALVCATADPAVVRADSAGSERVLLLIDPQDADSVAIGNHYATVRRIPASHIIYIPLAATDYQEFASNQIPAILGTLRARKIDSQIDFIVVASRLVYRYSAADLVSEINSTCPAPVNYISLTSALATARFAGQILAGDAMADFGLTTSVKNGYYAEDDSSLAFSGADRWLDGLPTQDAMGRRYFIASMLGYTGTGGNSVGEIIDMIDRSDAADGTNPEGAFYYMVTDDIVRTAPREPFFDAATNSIEQMGGDAVRMSGLVPPMGVDVLGIMTGTNSWSVQPGDLTLAAGAFCDHLTSFAADFDNPSQTKISDWIRIGASGSHGTVEEPCAVAGKFPHPRMHVHYFSGLTLGESVYRSLEYIPLQTLVYGDPLTRPFATLPLVTVSQPLENPATGFVEVVPMFPGGGMEDIDRVELHIDGIEIADLPPGLPFFFNSAQFCDGSHEMRLVAIDDLNKSIRGDWRGTFEIANLSRSIIADIEPKDGDVTTSFLVKGIASSNSEVKQIRIKVNDRVMAVVDGAIGAAPVAGFLMGQGSVKVVAEALYADGRTAVSKSHTASVDPVTGACCLPDGKCRQHSEAICDQLGGWFSTNGVACDSVNCPTCGTGDLDSNGAIDLKDLDGFSACFTGSLAPPDAMTAGVSPQCLCAFDFDDDGDVDASDTLILAPAVSGPRAADQGLQPYDQIARIDSLDPTIINLTATDSEGAPLTFELTQPPAGALSTLAGSLVLITPLTSATSNSVSTLGFSVENSAGISTNGKVLLEFGPEFGSVVGVSVDGVGEASARVTFSIPDTDGAVERFYPFDTEFAATNSTVQLEAEDFKGVSPFERWVINGNAMPLGMNPMTIALTRNTTAVAAYTPKSRLVVKTSIKNTQLIISPDPSGPGIDATPFHRDYLKSIAGVSIFPLAPPPDFLNWKLDGIDQAPGTFITVNDLTRNRVAAGIFANVPGDFDADGDVDLADAGAFSRCFSGDAITSGFTPPTPACINAFDIEGADGDVDDADWNELASRMTGPF